MKIGNKLTGAFLLVAMLVAAVGYTGIWGLGKLMASADYILDEKVPIADASMEATIDMIKGRDLMGEYLLNRDFTFLDNAEKEFAVVTKLFDEHAKSITDSGNAELAAMVKEVKEMHDQFRQSAASLMQAHRQRLSAEASADEYMDRFDENVATARGRLEEYEAKLTSGNNAIDKRVDAAMESKAVMFDLHAIAEEYLGLKTLDETEELRSHYMKGVEEFRSFEEYLPKDVVAKQEQVMELAVGPGKMFDQKDAALKLQVDAMNKMALVDDFSKKSDALLAKVEEIAQNQMAASMLSADNTHAFSNRMIILITVFSIIASMAIGFALGVNIARPLKTTVTMIEEMEKGHLDMRLKLTRQDEIGVMARTMDDFADSLEKDCVGSMAKLAEGNLTFEVTPRDSNDKFRGALKKACHDLNDILSQVLSSGEQVAYASGQVSGSSQSLSQGATEQASSLEEISSSLTEMASQTRLSAENANKANQLSNEAKVAAENGNQQMKAMVQAMTEINDSGQNISKIIKVIDEIAFQTNLLALNAAVEAARAGKHGKGFAVVAEEVRNLAARSAKAAKETAELIEGSVNKTGKGSQIANQTAEALEGIVHSIKEVTNLVDEIATSSNEQAQGISQINEGLTQIDQVTQQNTANAEESAAAAEELSAQAQQLQALLSNFTLKNMPTMKKRYVPDYERQPLLTGKTKGNGDGKKFDWRGGEEIPIEEISLDDKEFGKYSNYISA